MFLKLHMKLKWPIGNWECPLQAIFALPRVRIQHPPFQILLILLSFSTFPFQWYLANVSISTYQLIFFKNIKNIIIQLFFLYFLYVDPFIFLNRVIHRIANSIMIVACKLENILYFDSHPQEYSRWKLYDNVRPNHFLDKKN